MVTFAKNAKDIAELRPKNYPKKHILNSNVKYYNNKILYNIIPICYKYEEVYVLFYYVNSSY